MTRIGPFTLSGASRGLSTCVLELWHDGLGKHRLIRGGSEEIVRRKAVLQAADWDARWRAIEGRRRDRAAPRQQESPPDERRDAAIERADRAKQELAQIDSLLKFALAVYDPVEWQMLKESGSFDERRPDPEAQPEAPAAPELPLEPQISDSTYRPALGILDHLAPARKALKLAESRARFAADHARWERSADDLRNAHADLSRRHFERVALRAEAHAFNVAAWELRRREFLERKAATNGAVEASRSAYFALAPDAVAEYCDLVLSQSQYPDCFPREFDLDYHAAGRLLVVDYLLPAPADLPTLEAVREAASLAGFEEQHVPEASASARYDDVLCKVALRTVHELFEADTAGALQSIIFNGIVSARSRPTSPTVTACVLSLRAHREAFQVLHLAQVDPRGCLEALGGIAGPRLHELSPVTPLVPLRAAHGRKPLPREHW